MPQVARPEPATRAEKQRLHRTRSRGSRCPSRSPPGDGELKVVVFADPPGLVTLAVELADGARLDASPAPPASARRSAPKVLASPAPSRPAAESRPAPAGRSSPSTPCFSRST